ncbi:MAG: hypothetical protein B7X59_07725 [Polaromonas sp. 39-63-203]|jgi:hypothetical protein|uniref:hypothetical protein n=1 Tax=Polaromonas sp. TaxID=1869339 RepID=UPI000BC60ADD|nr:hypothetical protein [Polaromonas sp.]OYY52583.1 MAG: hypothetical protein B7Y54_06415 [Polaromonas sp. 35-63-240]OYZ83864.1 MAG: hypothetical protein B7Y03_06885 [Polaromonas sp. 24-62-144]OZA97552.1 MAG: hypothetical protein B7X59_07725 [Polaromonas sp. 39-63-203]HQS33412.1 hypothetical protein [Polaromonas sp.]HQS92323.1 hypothetical protein [Polaromonas sp.]
MSAHEKAAGVLPTPATAIKNQTPVSVNATAKKGNRHQKAYAKLRAEFATLGRKVSRIHRLDDRRISYAVAFRGESRHLANTQDLKAHLIAIRGSR